MEASFISGQSYLLHQAETLKSDSFPEIPLVDQIIIDGSLLTAKELRGYLGHAIEKPFGARRLLVINQADQLSEILQNTLLKTLEEPAGSLVIILQSSIPERLLPTVRSRLEPLRTSSVRSVPLPVFAATNSELATQLVALKTRDELRACLQAELAYQLFQAGQQLNPTAVRRLSTLERAILKLERNCNQKLITDWLLLHWEENSGNG